MWGGGDVLGVVVPFEIGDVGRTEPAVAIYMRKAKAGMR